MNDIRYRYELDATALDYIMKLLGQRPHDEVRGIYDHFLRGKIEQDKEHEQQMKQDEEQRHKPGITGMMSGGIAQANGEIHQGVQP